MVEAKVISAPNPIGHVYLLRNYVNGKGYVGQTRVGLARRRKIHINAGRRLRNGSLPKDQCQLITQAISTFGSRAFQMVASWPAHSPEQLDEIERQKIAELGTLVPGGYNIETGGIRGRGRHPNPIVMSFAQINSPAGRHIAYLRRTAAGIPIRDEIKAWRTLVHRAWRAANQWPAPRRYRQAEAAVRDFFWLRLTGHRCRDYMSKEEKARRQSLAQSGRPRPHRGVPWSPAQLAMRRALALEQGRRIDGRFC